MRTRLLITKYTSTVMCVTLRVSYSCSSSEPMEMMIIAEA
jgi:hypothetical protein